MSDTEDRIRTTHVGSLPRPPELLDLIERREQGQDVPASAFESAIEEATREVVRRQREVGLDVINDGEQPRVAFNFYVEDRLDGLGGESAFPTFTDLDDYPEYAGEAISSVLEFQTTPAVVAPLEYDPAPARAEIEASHELLDETNGDDDTFVTAATPGTLAYTFGNEYYDTYEEKLFALAEAMSEEYELIADATDAQLQLDAPDLLMGAHHTWKDHSIDEFREVVRLHVEAINDATAGVPRERLRLHTCWGNYEGPHHHDVPLSAVIDELYRADVGILSIEQSNPRHQHEYDVFEEHPLPDDLTFMPGVIDTKTNFVEHPEVVAERLERAATAIGDPGRIVAAPDCGFDTFADLGNVDREIVWAKLEALVDGARLASERLF
ncbi:cobalamin-independent methionine synthase II family protein [Halalkaliarchaeum sp. AArc-GB]|uniref:cobalamin-independent methionine synthase II family protein n=1 Tax=Halalkaliarchaeum sp. AArc-GB TaxID=3074078 RepID=UPI002866C7E8|nr:cobalamin-independent methionine synthase II family protein [Halalkaliarchaeum sp. AArc-GB]MDR5674231.1 cobalamin-independent methionine synthase II family protein [Halalkaliarchaeum sp. AArc-GB]